MPQFQAVGDMESHSVKGGFQFSAAKISTLGATEYTLATVVLDGSGSTRPYWDRIVAALKETVRACRRSPRADNLMLRVVIFSAGLDEVHGFKPLPSINEGDYDGLTPPGSTTALFDASYSAVKATAEYGRQLIAAQFSVNGAVYIITDGADYPGSTVSAKMVGEAVAEARSSEALESIVPVLIGVNTDASDLNTYLERFKNEAGFQQYVSMGKADEKQLAKLGGFISKSISSQSQALGTGGPSQSLTF